MIVVTKSTKLYVGDIVSVDEFLGWCKEGTPGKIIAITPPETGWKEQLYYVSLDSGKRLWARAIQLKLIKKGARKK